MGAGKTVWWLDSAVYSFFEAIWGSIEVRIIIFLSKIRIAIAGDLHGLWSESDHNLLNALAPDAILFVGDLGNGEIRIVKAINEIEIPTAVVLGNHDRGIDISGYKLQTQIGLLGDKFCSWWKIIL